MMKVSEYLKARKAWLLSPYISPPPTTTLSVMSAACRLLARFESSRDITLRAYDEAIAYAESTGN